MPVTQRNDLTVKLFFQRVAMDKAVKQQTLPRALEYVWQGYGNN
jgi:hypothetical protein